MEKIINKCVGVVGAGYVGLCTGALLSEMDKNIIFVDINEEKIKTINKGKSPVYEPGLDELVYKGVLNGKIRATTKYTDLKQCKTFIVSVNTPINDQYDVNLEFLIQALKSLVKVVSKGSLIIIRSTIPPLTTRDTVIPIFREVGFEPSKDLYFAVMPERLAEGHALKDIKENPIIIGVMDDDSFEKVVELWKPLNLKTIKLNLEEAELTKLADNLWIDLNIALSNEIALVSEKIGADARKVVEAANTLKKGYSYVNILTPGIGVGGSCLPKDPYILKKFAEKLDLYLKIPQVSREVNDFMPIHVFNLILKNMKSNDKKILLLGVSFNSNSGDMRYSPLIYLNEKLQKAGFSVYAYDPLVSENDSKVLNGVKMLKNKDEFFLTLNNIDIIVVGAAHNEFKPMIPEILKYTKNKIIIDGRYLFNREEVIKSGTKYIAVGVGY